MIVRCGIACDTCGQSHVVRIGMGQEEYQSHRFQCANCSEDIVIALNVDYDKTSHWVTTEENAQFCKEDSSSKIINLDANFLVPKDQRGVDGSFFRLEQLCNMVKDGTIKLGDDIPFISKGRVSPEHFRRPDYAAEWRKLRKSWSLHRNGHGKLSQQKAVEASKEYYRADPLNDLEDWVWRLSWNLCGPAYEEKLNNLMKAIRPILESQKFSAFKEYYKSDILPTRGQRYFDAYRAYFENYSEFSQVIMLTPKGINIPEDYQASSVNFDAVKMFYGNIYETFASHVDILAFLNNIISGRDFDKFSQLSLRDYYKLDKSGRFGPFSMNKEFSSLCEEADNQIRNASHHGGMTIDKNSQTIHYRAGKGGTGQEHTMSYAQYLGKSSRIFLQTLTLLRLELILCKGIKFTPPL